MKIKFLGTAAAEGIPAFMCNCDVCTESRKKGGKNLRTRSQAMLDDDLMLDMPPDTFAHIQANGIDTLKIKHWLLTHNHTDHFYPKELPFTRNGNFAHYSDSWHGIDFYGSIDFKSDFDSFVCDEEHKKYIRFNPCEAFVPFKAGDYTVTPLKAKHGTDNPLIYSVSKNGKHLLYAHDTGPFFDEVWDYLRSSEIVYDLVSLDCTAGAKWDYDYPMHMCLGWDTECRDRLISIGAADKSTVFVLNHFSHNGPDTVYDSFKPIAEKQGFIASYDGMEIEF